jgi:hypothetical protein
LALPQGEKKEEKMSVSSFGQPIPEHQGSADCREKSCEDIGPSPEHQGSGFTEKNFPAFQLLDWGKPVVCNP